MSHRLSQQLAHKLNKTQTYMLGKEERQPGKIKIPFYIVKASMKYICIYRYFYLSNAKHGESIGIGLAASSTSKGPQIKTREPMVSIKVTNCSIQFG